MKNQYFGDTRDLFKYDLVLEVLLGLRSARRFTFIPMLTPNDGNGHGSRTNYERAKAGRNNRSLIEFLTECVQGRRRRNIKRLREYFDRNPISRRVNLAIYEEEKYFDPVARATYFRRISAELLSDAVILLDPDNGFEVSSVGSGPEKYLKYEELQCLSNRMRGNSTLIAFQYIPRVKRLPYFRKIARRLRQIHDHPILLISDNQVVFFILAKAHRVRSQLRTVLAKYAEQYGLVVREA